MWLEASNSGAVAILSVELAAFFGRAEGCASATWCSGAPIWRIFSGMNTFRDQVFSATAMRKKFNRHHGFSRSPAVARLWRLIDQGPPGGNATHTSEQSSGGRAMLAGGEGQFAKAVRGSGLSWAIVR